MKITRTQLREMVQEQIRHLDLFGFKKQNKSSKFPMHELLMKNFLRLKSSVPFLIDFSLNMKDTPDNDISLRLQALYIHGNGSEYTVQEYFSNAESIFYRDAWAGPSYCSTLESSLSANVIEEEDLYLSNDFEIR